MSLVFISVLATFLSFISCFFIWAVVLAKDSKDQLNRAFFIYLSCLVIFLFQFLADRTLPLFFEIPHMYFYWIKIIFIFIFMFHYLFIKFIYIFCNKEKNLFYKIYPILIGTIYLIFLHPNIGITGLAWMDNIFYPQYDLWGQLGMFSIIVLPTIYAIKILFDKYRITTNKEQKGQIFLMLSGISTSFLLSFALESIFPVLFFSHISAAFTTVPFMIQAVFIYQAMKKYNFLSIHFSDITKTIFSSCEDLFIVVNDKEEILKFNQTALNIFPKLSLPNIRISEVINGNVNLDKNKKIQEIALKRSEKIINYLYSKNPIRRKEQEIGSILILREITELKRLEEQMHHMQKMESIGTLAAGISHEINTPLQFIDNNLSFFKSAQSKIQELIEKQQAFIAERLSIKDQEKIKDLNEEAGLSYLLEELPDSISSTHEGIKRITKIVNAMKSFAYTNNNKRKEPADIHAAIENTLIITANEWKYIAEIEKNFDPEVSLVSCYIEEINQVILNLIINAAYAIKEKYQERDVKEGLITITTKKDNQYVYIVITDNGIGINLDLQKKIFDPFFTTKPVGTGTGQGLNISFQIIQKHKGKITVESQKGVGTSFQIQLPLTGT